MDWPFKYPMFLYKKQNILGKNFGHTMIKDYEDSKHHSTLHFQDAKKLEGTQKFHSYIPRSDDEAAVKWFLNGIRMGKEKICTYILRKHIFKTDLAKHQE